MDSELSLITTLAFILIAAGVFTIISKALRQPVVLGYIIAGFIISPRLGLVPDVISEEAVHQWSNIGIIFLLYGLGLEFSFKKLIKVGSSAITMAVAKCVGMFAFGIIAGRAMGWELMESIFLGGLMSMSSTTVIIKAYEDMGLKKESYAPVLFGSLVVEDLIAVLLMVLFSTMAESDGFSGLPVLKSLLKLSFFVVLWYLIGIFAIPMFLKKCKRFLNDEILLIVSIGLCFSMVAISSITGFSAALGAFVMGSILAETVDGERIEKLTAGIKNLFGAIFFVSVGMMVNPSVIGAHWGSILVITLVSMIGIILTSSSGAIVAGLGLDTAVHTSFSLAQLGEFAFILAGLGCELGVMRDFIYPVIITVSVITTFTTPYMIRVAGPTSKLLHKVLPAEFIVRISKIRKDDVATSMEQKDWKMLFKNYFIRIGLYSVMLSAILMLSQSVPEAWTDKMMPDLSDRMRDVVLTIVTLIAMLPFLYGLSVTSGSISKPAQRLLKTKDSNKWTLISLVILRSSIASLFVILAILERLPLNPRSITLIVVGVTVMVLIGRRAIKSVSGLEKDFMANLNEKEIQQMREAPVTASVNRIMAGYDVHLENMDISPDFKYLGKTLREMPFRHRSGVNILKITRGGYSIIIPSGDEQIFPHDKLLAVGTSAQLEEFKKIMDENMEMRQNDTTNFDVQHYTVQTDDNFCDKTLRSIKIRNYGCMVLSVLRGDEFTANPPADFKFMAGDIIWMAGNVEAIKYFI